MPTKERDVVLTGKEKGVETIDLPITRLGNIEDGAEIKTALVDNDALPVIDSVDGNEMKKITWSNVKAMLKTWLDSLYNKVAVNNTLTSDSTTEALSAAQGKALKTAVDGKAASTHTHAKSQITDFPTSMPASDVQAWAKAATRPTYTASDVDLGNVTNESKTTMFTNPSFTGAAKVAAGTDYTTAKLRNITLSTAAASGGSNGDIWIQYT